MTEQLEDRLLKAILRESKPFQTPQEIGGSSNGA